ncbi:MAG: nucleoside hydrolase [Clostridia bacterium]|nr:nucleoside hydrolase [Clostridia bacterium]
MKKLNLIIDTDLTKGIDDRFALAYAFANHDKVNVRAVTIEPYKSIKKGTTIEDMQLDSKFEAMRILSLMNVDSKNLVFEGEKKYFSLDKSEVSNAVKQMAKVLEKYQDVVIVTIGVLTNVARLVMTYPELKDKIKVVWIGTGNLLLDEFCDSNYKNDKNAFEYVLKSGIDLTIIPHYTAKEICSSVYEMEHNISETAIGKYLIRSVKENTESEYAEELKTIYDIVPMFYVLEPEAFKQKMIDANELLKEQEKMKKTHNVNYVFEIIEGAKLWKNFIESINTMGNNPFAKTVFFISDTHFSQKSKVLRKQVPFKTVEESDAELVRRWNQTVSKNDDVYHLGDFGNYEKIRELNGNVYLICGNYEEIDAGENFAAFRAKLMRLGFKDVYQKGIYLDESIFGQKVFLTHKPTTHAKDAFTMFGHVHNLAPVKKFGFNVCVSYHNFAPVSIDEAKRYIDFIQNHPDADVLS